MTNFNINFANPWLLLLLVPALGFTLFSYLRLNRKYRCNRNRITSIVMHSIVMVLSIAVLSNMTFSYDLPNDENQMIVLVDCSYSNAASQDLKDQFVEDIIVSVNSGIQVGVVKFGYDQVLAVPLTNEHNTVYSQYLSSAKVNDTGSDIASALNYAKSLLTYPETSKIVLLTDGIETDGEANKAVASLALEGIKLDVVHYGNNYDSDEAQIVSAEAPTTNIEIGESIQIEVGIRSNYDGAAVVHLLDNGQLACSQAVILRRGTVHVNLEHAFADAGLHQLEYQLELGADTVAENNNYVSYLYLEDFDKILIMDTNGESTQLEALLNEDNNVEARDIIEAPATLDELREYDQVILMNVAHSDLPEGFEEILYSYVYEVGGGLLTVGGGEYVGGEFVAHSYNIEDMYGTIYSDMLPVEVMEYKPPVGVMIIVDKSGSMTSPDSVTGKSLLDLAKEGAVSCLNALEEMDWCGVMTLDSEYATSVSLTPMTQKSVILDTIYAIDKAEGSTFFNPAIEQACRALSTLSAVERRHIIIVSDGQPTDQDESYIDTIGDYNEKYGITLSVVSLGSKTAPEVMEKLAESGGGMCYGVEDMETIPRTMREDLKLPMITEVNMETFQPTVSTHTDIVAGVVDENIPTLDGFYGSKVKKDAVATLMGAFVPIYAQWDYGAGKVGSFMCDLDGTWSTEFLNSATGQLILNNIANELFPAFNIRPQTIAVEFVRDNYTTQASIFTELNEGESLMLTLTSPKLDDAGKSVVTEYTPNVAVGVNRIEFETMDAGVYHVLISKLDSEGNSLVDYETYLTFSYSEEYNMFIDENVQGLPLAESLASIGNGEVITAAFDSLNSFSLTINKTFDPRLIFMIVAVVLFLLDVAVRKFKFKWPHEIIANWTKGKKKK